MFFVEVPPDNVRLALVTSKVGSEAPKHLGLVPDRHKGTQFFTDDDVVHGPERVYAGLASHRERVPEGNGNINKSRMSPIFRLSAIGGTLPTELPGIGVSEFYSIAEA